MKIRETKNPCALCGGHEWICYDGDEDEMGVAHPVHSMLDWTPLVDYYENPDEEDGTRCGWFDECVNCKAVVS